MGRTPCQRRNLGGRVMCSGSAPTTHPASSRWRWAVLPVSLLVVQFCARRRPGQQEAHARESAGMRESVMNEMEMVRMDRSPTEVVVLRKTGSSWKARRPHGPVGVGAVPVVRAAPPALEGALGAARPRRGTVAACPAARSCRDRAGAGRPGRGFGPNESRRCPWGATKAAARRSTCCSG